MQDLLPSGHTGTAGNKIIVSSNPRPHLHFIVMCYSCITAVAMVITCLNWGVLAYVVVVGSLLLINFSYAKLASFEQMEQMEQ